MDCAIAMERHRGGGLERVAPGVVFDPEAAGAAVLVGETQLKRLRLAPDSIARTVDATGPATFGPSWVKRITGGTLPTTSPPKGLT